MKADLLQSYIKYNYKRILISLAIFIVFAYLSHGFAFYILFFLLGSGREYFQYNARLEKIKRLKAKGLTEQDLRNIEFVKQWEENREGGLWKYCIRDGGIIAGAALSVLITLVYFAITPAGFKNIMATPGNMFSLIGYAYIAGAALGVMIYRILWSYNEKRFKRLTDPLNILFASVNASFNEPA